MRRFTVLACGLAVLIGLGAPHVSAEDTGDLQVTCWPGHRIYLDAAFAGLTTEDQDGLYLPALPAGDHVIRVEKLGHEPRSFSVTVPAGGVVELKVGRLPVDAAALPEPRPGPAPAPAPVAPAQAAPEPGKTAPGAEPQEVRAPAPEPAVAAGPERPAVTPPAPPYHAPEPPDQELARLVRHPRTGRAEDVMFVYRVRGAALDGDATVAINRERGGPRAPVLAFLCSDPGECLDQTGATYPPGSYRFRVSFRRPGPDGRHGSPAFSHEMFQDLDARSGAAYLVDVVYDDDSVAACRLQVRELADEALAPVRR